jgi:hypothetical protein
MQTKAEMTEYLTDYGLVVEGDETAAELNEACKYMRAYQKG